MTYFTRKHLMWGGRALAALTLCAVALWQPAAEAAVPGITGGTGGSATFSLIAQAVYISQPDGASIYSFGYGCAVAPAGYMPAKLGPGASPTPNHCAIAQIPGPTLIVHEGDAVTINLANLLPYGAPTTSIVFSGQQVTATGGVPGILVQEASAAAPVIYKFTASKPGTFEYHSGTRPELQVEMGLYGVLIVLPAQANLASCGAFVDNTTATHNGQPDYRLAASAYDHPQSCYDREYMFQLTEMDSNIHADVLTQVKACGTTTCPEFVVKTDPYKPNYFLINGRSMPDDMDVSFAPQYPYQPYNGNPHMHPGETMLVREVAHGRIQHPLHIHGNHARILARDGNLLLSATDGTSFAGPLVFTYPSVSGQATDSLFGWTGKGLNWDIYGHANTVVAPGKSTAGNGDASPCYADANGFYTSASSPAAVPGVTANYGEWCLDHNRPIPITPPDPQIVANGLWYGGTPYLGVQKVFAGRPQFVSTPLPPGTSVQNPEAGYAFMWHSHDEREITTNDVFPGGMMMMLLIDPPSFVIDETL